MGCKGRSSLTFSFTTARAGILVRQRSQMFKSFERAGRNSDMTLVWIDPLTRDGKTQELVRT